MEANQFTEYLKSLSAEMQVTKDRIRLLIGDRHWQTDGEHKEAILRKMIRSVIPSKLSICRGFMVNHLQDGTGQIDILILDRLNKPVLFQDDELVITTPDCVRGIIEVKTRINSATELDEILLKMSDYLEFQKKYSDIAAFGGLFVYEDSAISNEDVLKALYESAKKDQARAVNWMSIGLDRFFRFWPNELNPAAKIGGDSFWHSYELRDLSQAYFISNVMWDVSKQGINSLFSVERADKVWFPLPEGKEFYKNGSIGLNSGIVDFSH
ncbi:MAG: DUF6602 domain-containing protein [Candidatus Omnitrophota bacterium]|jgi:hypothetical protein